MRHNEEIKQIREDLDKLLLEFDSLSKALINSQIVSEYLDINYEKHFTHRRFRAVRKLGKLSTRLNMILEHLNLEFNWIDCKPHYELKEREDK